jgi:hypothetical protein
MALYKRGKVWYMLAVVNGVYYRESLKTTDWREAQKFERQRLQQLEKKAPDFKKRTASFGAMDIKNAIETYITERQAQVSPRMVAYWRERDALYRST